MRNIFSKKFIIIWLIITAVGFICIKKLIIDDNNILTYKYYEDYVSEKELYAKANYDCPRPLFSKAAGFPDHLITCAAFRNYLPRLPNDWSQSLTSREW